MTTNQQRKEFLNAALSLVEGTPTHLREIFTVHVLSDLDIKHLKYSFQWRKIKKSVKKIMGKLELVVWLISVPALLCLLPGREELAKRDRVTERKCCSLKNSGKNEPSPPNTVVQL